jgi:proline iminopeptidase
VALLRTTEGRRLFYETHGSGQPLVCIPGGPGLSSRLLGDLGGLSRECQLVLADPRGSGRSDPPPRDDLYRLADFAADVELLRSHLGLRRIALLGHSAGASIALTYAAEHPECVERLVLVGAAARFADDHEAVAAAMREARSGEPWYRDAAAVGATIARADRSMTNSQLGALLARGAGFCFARYGPRQAAYAALLRDEGVNVAAWLAADEGEDLRPLLPRITAPTLVVAGEEDCLVAPVASQELAEGLAHGQTVVLADAGHYPWVDQPEPFRSAVGSFLDRS